MSLSEWVQKAYRNRRCWPLANDVAAPAYVLAAGSGVAGHQKEHALQEYQAWIGSPESEPVLEHLCRRIVFTVAFAAAVFILEQLAADCPPRLGVRKLPRVTLTPARHVQNLYVY